MSRNNDSKGTASVCSQDNLGACVLKGKKQSPSTVPQHIPDPSISPGYGISFSRTQLSFSGLPCNGHLLHSPDLPVRLPDFPGKRIEKL